MANINVTVTDGNNIVLSLTPPNTQVVTIDRGIAGPVGPAGPSGTPPGGSNTQVQYNNAGAFAGSANLTFNGTTLAATLLTTTGNITPALSSNYAAGTLNRPSIRPSLLLDFANTRTLDPRITFARASTATFYDPTSSAVAEQNLLLQSEAFDTGAWIKDASTVTANSTFAPDGTTTAGTLIEDTATFQHGIRGAISLDVGATFTISIFAKTNGRNFLHLSYNASASNFYAYATFNVLTGAVTASGAAGWTFVSTAIASAPNGFYRCSLTFTVISQAGASPCFCASNTGTPTVNATGRSVYTGSGSDALFLWGAQLEQRSTVTAYTPTTTAAITNYIPVLQTAASGVARFDCNPVTRESLGLLIEESKTNLLTYSSGFDNAIWGKFRATITPAADVAPDGTLTASKFVEDTSVSQTHLIRNEGFTYVNGTTYTATIYAKAGDRPGFEIRMSGVVLSEVGFNLTTGTIAFNNGANVGASITAVGNGWYRCSASYLYATGTGPIAFDLWNGTTVIYTGNGYSGIFIWGAQLEAGAFATSYIPTVASQVTRAADSASMTGTNFSSWFNASAGSLYCEAATYAATNSQGVVAILDSTKTNAIGIQAISGNGYENVVLNNSEVAVWNNSNSINTAKFANRAYPKVAISYSIGSSNASVNGVAGTTASNTNVPANLSTLAIGGGQSYGFTGAFKRIAYYPVALTSPQLQGLTS